ncbi:hypothetical protein PCYB_003490, partial [Plasmodium cynomolgi strain B]
NRRTKPVNRVKHNKSIIQDSIGKEEEYDIAIKIAHNPYRNKTRQSLIYDYKYKKDPELWLEKVINKLDSKFASEMTRFLRMSSRRTRNYKGKGLSGYFKSLFSKYRVFIPLATSIGLFILAIYIVSSISSGPFILILLTALLIKFTAGMSLYYILRTIHLKYYS